MTAIYALSAVIILGVLLDGALIALNLKVASKRVATLVWKKLIQRFILLIAVLSWVLLIYRGINDLLALYYTATVITAVVLSEGVYILLSKQSLRVLLRTLLIYFLSVSVFLLVTIVFFGVIHPLILFILLLVSTVIIRLVLVPRTVRKIHNKFRLVTYHHGLYDTFFEGLVEPNKVYMIDSDNIALGMNAMLLDVGKARTMYLSRGLLSSMSSAMTEGIMAHEMGHAKNRHMKKRIWTIIPLIMTYFMIYTFLFQYTIAQLTAYEFWTVVVLTTLFVIRLFKAIIIRLLQQQEFEADHYAKEKGYSVHLADALIKIEKRTDDSAYHPLYASTHRSHPVISKRVDKLKE